MMPELPTMEEAGVPGYLLEGISEAEMADLAAQEAQEAASGG